MTAVFELGIRYNTGPTQIREISDRHAIPQHYLEQILVHLKKAGMVESFRGAQGGYALVRSPREITVLEVLSVLEGRLEVVGPDRRTGDLGLFWNALEASIQNACSRTIEELIIEKQKHEQHLTYSI